MSEAISRSPELCTRVLKVVNSAFYGLPGQVSSVPRAVGLVGLVGIRNVAIAASLTRVFQGRPLSVKFSPRDLWTHSLAVGATARLVATATMTPLADEALLAGLIHDIGLMVELQYDRGKLASVLAQLEEDDTLDVLAAEDRCFGATHQDFGAGLSRHWNLPPSLTLVTGAHHCPSACPERERPLVTMVHVADRLVARCQPGFLFDRVAAGIGDDVLDELRLTRGQIDAIAASLPAAVEEMNAILPGP